MLLLEVLVWQVHGLVKLRVKVLEVVPLQQAPLEEEEDLQEVDLQVGPLAGYYRCSMRNWKEKNGIYINLGSLIQV